MGGIELDGDQNRVAGRDYVEINLAAQEREPLAQAQRARLNEEVAKLSEELGMDPRMLWRSVHESTGVKTIGEVKKDQFQDALAALQAVREQHQEKTRAQALITELEQAAAERGLARQLARYCLREFGEQALTGLSIAQLTQALRYVDEYQAPPPVASPLSWPGFRRLVMNHPWQFAAVFVAGALVGRVF
ncbi:hypothetical protein [Pseudomonas aeruginosa]|uniref:hypothetical protein n=1 Tax=Pseudomonas aeruginosa TaxID=287 RepID=UPI001E3DC857|nr:hypothetical protein [Pseudomonas aeruginosa]MCD2761378.1 hypothetical protein [Pseudomonas aeruginosa]HBP0991506.1 hypothetical protein [Pseudomonas aeruginosa]HBP1202101.1 hypothetical protein [Pseudomonas aeruginosa]